SIYNVNNGSNTPTSGPCVNCSYYVDNSTGTYAITYDGFTTPITAEALVFPCQTYHIKLAVADVNDQTLDSGVLLKAGSFSSGGQVNMNHFSNNGQSNNVIEGCDNYWVFGRVDTTNLVDSILVDLILTGTADVATDLSSFTTTFYIPSGQIYDTLYYSAIMDNIPEGVEYIVFSLVNGCPCSTTTTSDTIWIYDNYILNPTITANNQICSGNNFTISTTVNTSINPAYITYLWDNGSTTSSITDAPTATTTYNVTITHECFPDTVLSMTLTVIPDLGAGFSATDYGVCIGQTITFTFTDTAGVNANYAWTFNGGNPASGNAQGPYNVTWNTAGTYNVSLHVDDSGCFGDSTVQVIIFPYPSLTFTPVDALCFGSCDAEITAIPNGTAVPYTYIWNDPGAQTTETITGLCPGTYNVTATNANGCSVTGSSSVSQPTQVTANASGTNETCFGISDGTATVNASGGTGTYSYLWSNGDSTQSINSLSSGTYTVTVSDQNGCTTTSSTTISSPLAPLASTISGTDITCFGFINGTVNLEVTGGTTPYSYIWNSGQATQDLNNVPPGTYNVTVTDFNGCTITQSIILSEPTQITYTTTTTPASCFGGSDGNATIIVSNGTPPYTYFWSNGGMGSSLNNIQPGIYSVTVTDNQGCTVSASATVLEPDKVIASIGSDRWICIGETTTLNTSATGGTPGYTYQWCHGPTGNSIDVSPIITTQYCVKAIDINDCESGLKYVTVFVYEPISISVSADKYEICIGDPVILNTTVSGGNGNYNYTLTNNGNTITLPFTDYPQGSITYEILASDNCGSPTDQASVDIIVNPLPPVSFMPDTTQGCRPLAVNFIEISPVSGQIYNWNFGDDNSYNTSNLKDPLHIYEYDGTYTVSLTVTSDKGCKNTKVNADLITVYPIPNAKFIADPEVASIIKPIVFFENLSSGAINYHWMFGDGDSSLNVSPYHQYAGLEGVYIVELRVESEFGCKDTIFNSVIIRDEYTFYAPTAFSPDNDLVNDEFFIIGHGIDENKFQLLIYDRWGEVIFDTEDVNGKWNGKAKNGNKKCETGTYIWVAIFKDMQGIERQESGAVTIIR
ncbi:MAG: PKD domain-containing protein, partial [Bacteroidota bacterium]